MRASNLVDTAAGPALATDAGQIIVSSNRAACELLGYDQARLEGQDLYSVLEARDTAGNLLTGQSIAFWEMTRRGEAIRPFEMTLRRAPGEGLRVAASVVVVIASDDTYELVYLLRPMYRRRRADEVIERLLAEPHVSRALRRSTGCENAEARLTPRQIEVLRCLADGDSAEEIARRLRVSLHTVRSHIRSILSRLEVHSQTEAVSRAFRERLI